MSSLSPVNANEPATLPAQTEQQRIDKALALAVAYGGIDGDHHKAWVIDQMVRALTGCPVVQNEHTDSAGRPYAWLVQGGRGRATHLFLGKGHCALNRFLTPCRATA